VKAVGKTNYRCLLKQLLLIRRYNLCHCMWFAMNRKTLNKVFWGNQQRKLAAYKHFNMNAHNLHILTIVTVTVWMNYCDYNFLLTILYLSAWYKLYHTLNCISYSIDKFMLIYRICSATVSVLDILILSSMTNYERQHALFPTMY